MTETGIITKDETNKSVTFEYGKYTGNSGEFSFYTIASRSETLDIEWEYNWDHSWFHVVTKATFYKIEAGGIEETIALVDFGPGYTVGPRYNSGEFSIDVNEGDEYGVRIEGSHNDSNTTIEGTFIMYQQ